MAEKLTKEQVAEINKKLNSPVVITPGHMTGIITNLNAWNCVQPSTFALSSSSLGIFWKNECSIHKVNGWLIATKTIIVVGNKPHKFHWKNGGKYPATKVIGGIALKINAVINSQNVYL